MIDLAIPQKKFALVDCNSFFASCERVFNFEARKRPVAVLSNNDGCIIARSDEAKKLNIKMASALYQNQRVIEENNVMLFSSNFSLYGSLSRRVMAILAMYTPRIEIYSIDEAFLDMTTTHVADMTKHISSIRQHVLQWTDIPVSVGVGSTKTLSKAASKLSKKFPEHKSVLDLTTLSENSVDTLLSTLDVSDIWGVGFRYADLLRRYGITNAKQLKYADMKFIKRYMHVVGERTVLELQGISCIPLEENTKPKKGILSSKSFSSPVYTLDSLQEAVATYMARAAEKLRSQNSVTKCVSIFIRTNHFNKEISQYSKSYAMKLPYPTSFTPELIHYALACLDKIFIDGYKYHKAGVYLTNIIPDSFSQDELFGSFTVASFERKKSLMHLIDKTNRHYGKDAIFFATQGIHRDWKMKQARRSPRYTTNTTELLEVN